MAGSRRTGQAGVEPGFGRNGVLSTDATQLSRELYHEYQAGNIAAATALALRVAELKFESFGGRHVEFAAALSHYALLLQAGGDLEGARAGLDEVLDIKVENFGLGHLSVAQTLSQLGMLLVESQEWDDAEAALSESVKISRALLGEGHPSLATDLKMLTMLAERRAAIRLEQEQLSVPVQAPATVTSEAADAASTSVVSINTVKPLSDRPNLVVAQSIVSGDGMVNHVLPPVEVRTQPQASAPIRGASTTISAPAEMIKLTAKHAASDAKKNAGVGVASVAISASIASEVGSASLRDAGSITSEVQALAGVLTRIGRGMVSSGQRMKSQGLLPNPHLLHEATECCRKFAALCDEATRRAEALDLDLAPYVTPGEDRFSLPDLKLLFEEIFRTENDSAKHYLARKTTLALIARILDLTHSDPRKQSTLEPVLEMARRLQAIVKESPMGRAPAEALAVVEGSHPLFALDRLVTNDDELDDETWTRLYEILANSQGKRIAASAARKRLRLRPPVSAPAPTDPQASDSIASASTPQHVADLMDSLLDDEDFMPVRGNREALKNRIVIPDTPHKRPILGSAPRAGRLEPRQARAAAAIQVPPAAARIETPPEPVKTTRIDPRPEQNAISSRPVSRERDPYDFLQTQTSIITQ